MGREGAAGPRWRQPSPGPRAGTAPTPAVGLAMGREDAPVASAARARHGRGGGSPRPGAGLEGACVRPASRRSGGTVSRPRGRWLCTCSRLENKPYFSDGPVPACCPGMRDMWCPQGGPSPAPITALPLEPMSSFQLSLCVHLWAPVGSVWGEIPRHILPPCPQALLTALALQGLWDPNTVCAV